jgi:hypothetical protein
MKNEDINSITVVDQDLHKDPKLFVVSGSKTLGFRS